MENGKEVRLPPESFEPEETSVVPPPLPETERPLRPILTIQPERTEAHAQIPQPPLPEKPETAPLTAETPGSPEGKPLSIKELIKISQHPEEAAGHLRGIFNYERDAGRLTEPQRQKFLAETKYFAFDQIVKDIIWGTSMDLGYIIGWNIGLAKIVKNLADALGHSPLRLILDPETRAALFHTLGPWAIPLIIGDPSGFIRAPYCIARSIQEFNKIKQNEGARAALKCLPSLGLINLLNFVKVIGPTMPLFLSFHRNKDVGLALLNNRVQTGNGPQFIKRFTNWCAQRLFEKPKETKLKKLRLQTVQA